MSFDGKVQDAGDRVAHFADRIADLFKPGAKVTVYVRNPTAPDQDMLITSDDIAEAIKAMQRRVAAPDSKHGWAKASGLPQEGTA